MYLYAINFILYFLFFVFSCFGFVEFFFWDQVVSLWSQDISFNDMLLHPHGLRFILVSPLFVLSSFFDVSYDKLFTMSVPILLYFISSQITRSLIYLSPYSKKYFNELILLIVSVIIIFISFFMNGRIVFSLLGASIILYCSVCWGCLGFYSIVSRLIISIFLCSVSSGTFIVAIISWFALVSVNVSYFTKKNNNIFIAYLLIIVCLSPLISVLLFKVVSFFGGGFFSIYNLFSHGFFGGYVENLFSFFLFFCFSFFLMMVYCFVYFKHLFFPVSFTFISIIIGVFGISSAAMSVPSIIFIFVFLLREVFNLISNDYFVLYGDL